MKRVSSDLHHVKILGWVVVHPLGVPMWGTWGETKSDCWALAFDRMDGGFRYQYWNEWDKSMRAAAKEGYRFKRCTQELRVVE